MSRLSAAILLSICLTSIGSAQSVARVDAIYADLARPDHPGCAVAVVRDGKTILEKGYGIAHLEHAVPISPATVFYAGSVSKQFTAAAIARAVRDGKLSLDDDVRKWIPELPDLGQRITIRNLVHHTSGIRDYLALRSLAGEPADGVFGDDDVYALLARQRALNFAPGERYLYSNSGYWLMGQIIERATGLTLRQYTDSIFFRPLGMTRTHFRDDHARVAPGRAQAYAPVGEGEWEISMPNFDVVGAGGLHTTVRDLAKWDAMFYDEDPVTASLVRGLHQRGVLSSSDTIAYAFGLAVDTYRGLRRVSHGGAYGGYRAHLLRFPDQRFAVLQLCNGANANPDARSLRVAEVFIGDLFTEPEPRRADANGPSRAATSAIRLTAADLAALAGRYTSQELGADLTLTVRGDSLIARRRGRESALRATGTDEFLAPGMGTVRFQRDSAGTVTGFSVGAGRATGILYERVDGTR
jgi:CubicO group peptidase (beta-lactamase class C family)